MSAGMNANDWVGYLASLLVLVTFCMQGMVLLRAVAIASNVAFIAYAVLAGIGPVMLLHALLLPMNVYRLWQALHAPRWQRASDRRRVTAAAPGAMSTCSALDHSDKARR